MTKQLYEEALADVKKLKEVAEDNAKRALLEAVTPRIRDLIENQLLGEMGVDEIESDPDKLLMDEVPESDYLRPSVATAVVPSVVGTTPVQVSPSEETDCSPAGMMKDFTVDSTSDSDYPFLEVHNNLAQKINEVGGQIKNLTNASALIRESKAYESLISKLISEVEDTYSSLQNSMQESDEKSSYESVLENQYSTLKQLMEQKMKKTQKTLSEADLTLKLTGLPDEIEDALENVGVDLVMNDEGDEGGEDEGGEGDDEFDLDDEEGEDEGGSDEEEGLDFGDEEDSDESEEKMESRRLSDDTIVEIDEGMLRREISRMKALREENETKAQSWGHGPGDVSDEFAEDEMDPFDVKLTTEADDDNTNELDELDELDQAWSEGEETNVDEYAEGEANVDEMDEMDEAMHELEQSSDSRKHHGNVAKPETGAGAEKSDQNRMPNESLRRRIAAEMRLQTEAKKKASKAKSMKAMADKKKDKKKSKGFTEAYNFYATKFNESVARTNKLKGMLAEAARKGAALNGDTTKSAAETNLRNKLAETNLFNAKLLFTNKLLQNESLTKRQKAEVIERLDEAKNEREVKLVYESLVKTLSGTPSKITESADRGVLGSSSRPARPASATNTLNEGFEADRWARLAGIVK